MEKTVNGFFKCLLAQSIEKVPKDGFCGPGTSDDTKDQRLSCDENLCCGKGLFKDSPSETAVYSCQSSSDTWYKAKTMAGYEQY